MNPDNIPPQLLAMLLQNPEMAKQLAQGQGIPGLPGMRGGMPAPVQPPSGAAAQMPNFAQMNPFQMPGGGGY